MYLIDKNFGELGEFGYWQFIVAGVQQLVYGGALISKHSAQKKYLKTEKHTQQLTHESQMDLKQKELEAKQALLIKKAQTEVYADMRLKKLVIITFVTLLSVITLGIGTYYAFSAGGG